MSHTESLHRGHDAEIVARWWDPGIPVRNPTIGLDPGLSWNFTIDYQDVVRSDESSPVSLTIDWVPLDGAVWTAMAGLSAGGEFGEPIESSVYFFEHHRFDHASMEIREQTGTRIQVTGALSGDIDGLGLAQIPVEASLEFEGIRVSLADVTTIDQALQRLQSFADTKGLVGQSIGRSILFAPAAGSRGSG